MLSRIIAWVLAALTALMNNLGFWQQPEAVYVGDPGYAIQEDTVNYDQMRQWYNGSFVGENVCVVAAKSHNMIQNSRGYVYIIADQEINPQAQLVFSDGDVIVAPSRGRIVTQPSSSDKIVVQNDELGQFAYKMVINNPKKWFCCETKNVSPNGSFQHRQEDHRIDLKQGDTICVASSDTTIELYIGQANSTTLKSATLAEFLHSVDDELVKGNPDVNLNGSAEQIISNNASKDSLRSDVDIPDDKIYTGPSIWKQGNGGRWYYGRDTGTAGVDYAADQYAIYENDVYYFDSAGYMVTGWANDDHYYYPTDAYYSGKSSFKTGALCFDTMAPDPTDAGYYVYLNRAGEIVNSSEYKAMSAEGVTYTYDEAKGKYRLSFESGDNIDSSPSGGHGNNSGGPNIDNQEGTTATLTDEQWTAFTQNGESLDESMNGWYKHGDDWVYLTDGDATTPNAGNDYTVNEQATYGLSINGSEYLFYEDSNILVRGGHSGDAPVWGKHVSAGRTYWVLVIGDRGLARSEWYQIPDGRWVYAGTDCGLLSSGGTGRSADGIYNIHTSDEDSELTWYAFNDDCYMVTDQIVEGNDLGQLLWFELNGYKEGSRSKTSTRPGN